jgi:hypothetical protein
VFLIGEREIDVATYDGAKKTFFKDYDNIGA